MIQNAIRKQIDDIFTYEVEDSFDGFHWSYTISSDSETDTVAPDEVKPFWNY